MLNIAASKIFSDGGQQAETHLCWQTTGLIVLETVQHQHLLARRASKSPSYCVLRFSYLHLFELCTSILSLQAGPNTPSRPLYNVCQSHLVQIFRRLLGFMKQKTHIQKQNTFGLLKHAMQFTSRLEYNIMVLCY